MIAIVAWARRVLEGTRRRWRAVGIRFGRRRVAEPELEQSARQLLKELKASRPFQPSRDVMQAVLQRLRELEGREDGRRTGR